jgi:hypothetical protein
MKPAVPPVQLPVRRVGTPLQSAGTATPTSAIQAGFPYAVEQERRGKKREREDVGINVAEAINGVGVNGTNMNPPKAVLSAKAGMAGVRPRPIKKLRMVSAVTPLVLNSSLCLSHHRSIYSPSPSLYIGHPRTVEGCPRNATAYPTRRVTLPLLREPTFFANVDGPGPPAIPSILNWNSSCTNPPPPPPPSAYPCHPGRNSKDDYLLDNHVTEALSGALCGGLRLPFAPSDACHVGSPLATAIHTCHVLQQLLKRGVSVQSSQ